MPRDHIGSENSLGEKMKKIGKIVSMSRHTNHKARFLGCFLFFGCSGGDGGGEGGEVCKGRIWEDILPLQASPRARGSFEVNRGKKMHHEVDGIGEGKGEEWENGGGVGGGENSRGVERSR